MIYIIHIMRSDNAGGARGAWPSRPTVSVLPPGSRRQDAGTEPSPCRSFCHSFPSTLPIPVSNQSQPRRDRSAGVTPKGFRNPVLDSGRPKPQGPPQGPPQTPPVSSWRGSTGLRPCSRVERSPSVGRITPFGLRARRLPPRLPQLRRPCLHRGSHRGCHHGCHHGVSERAAFAQPPTAPHGQNSVTTVPATPIDSERGCPRPRAWLRVDVSPPAFDANCCPTIAPNSQRSRSSA